MTMSAIAAGIHVVGGCEIRAEEISIFEELTARSSIGRVDDVDFARVPRVHILSTCSDCMDYSTLGSGRGLDGLTGCQFGSQFEPAEKLGALVVIWENVEGVVRMHCGAAVQQIEQGARDAGFGEQNYHKIVHLARHGEPENRKRIIGVAFHDSVKLLQPFEFPAEDGTRHCAGEYLLPSSVIPESYWDDRPWGKIPLKRASDEV